MNQSMGERAAVVIEIDCAIKRLDDAIKTASSYDFSDNANVLLASQMSCAHYSAVAAWRWVESSIQPATSTIDAMSCICIAMDNIATAQKARACQDGSCECTCNHYLVRAKSSLARAKKLLGGK